MKDKNFFQIASSGITFHACAYAWTYGTSFGGRFIRDGVCECGRTVVELEYATSHKARIGKRF